MSSLHSVLVGKLLLIIQTINDVLLLGSLSVTIPASNHHHHQKEHHGNNEGQQSKLDCSRFANL
jgi:hypothetical protein